MKIKRVAPADFECRYMTAVPPVFKTRDTPLQIFDIRETAAFISLPTPLYRPDYNFIVHLTKGTASQQVDAAVKHISPHDVLFVKNGNVTALLETSDDVEGYVVIFEDSTLRHLLSKEKLVRLFSAGTVIPLPDEASHWLTPLFMLLAREIYQPAPDLEICYSLFQAALLKIIAADKGQHKSVNRSSEITFAFKELVYKHHVEERSVAFYVDKLAVSVNYLNRCVQQTLGTAPKEWINKVNIQHSQLLLQDFTKDIAAVAFELNYEDPGYFGRLFKKITRLTPSEYRASLMQSLS
ncbi:AraC family transcriptional regulator [Chitinophaga oryzae]|uniref:AraC family transcriptional regulator n=1 Tax=Chitinophaga oryzae TaxID=2725414 RepID=A0AAE7D7N5_9BACT|nr:helix-turn-helix domain-containing protein [Chitinophaga oryzae]QJB31874.1 AraC family transcriptional regulator [Chitinophaga oryzae]